MHEASCPLSRLLLWCRMQLLRQDAVGDMVRAVHQDPEVRSWRMHSAVLRHLQQTEAQRVFLPIFSTATCAFDHYHARQFQDMPCLVCRESLIALPREDVDVIWPMQAGLEGHTYFLLHKPCFNRIDQPALAVETLERLLNPQHGYKQYLTSGWWDALLRLWPLKKPVTRRTVVALAPEKALALSTRFDILKRDQYRCRLCGAAARDGDHVRLEVDHIVARYRGGTDDVSNLWTLCFACKRGKGTKDL